MLDLLRLKMPGDEGMLTVVVPRRTADLATWLAWGAACDAAKPMAASEAEVICKELLSLCRSFCSLLIPPERPGLYSESEMVTVALGLMLALVEPC